MSDDGDSSIVVIAMLGNVFSPRWAHARQSAPHALPLDFSALNVAIHHRGKTRWALTEHGRSAVERSPTELRIGRSDLAWRHGSLHAKIDERTAPWGGALRGRVTLSPLSQGGPVVALDPGAVHRWHPHTPAARVEVAFDEPHLRFTGTGYFDANAGDAPLEDAFASWAWSRMTVGDQVAIAYDVVTKDGTMHSRGMHFDRNGMAPLEMDATVSLPRTLFGLTRHARCEAATPAQLVRTVEDGPFYARSLVRGSVRGRSALGMHETVSLDRFRKAWVKFLIPFRMRVEAP